MTCPYINGCVEKVSKAWFKARCSGKYQLCQHYYDRETFKRPAEWLKEAEQK